MEPSRSRQRRGNRRRTGEAVQTRQVGNVALLMPPARPPASALATCLDNLQQDWRREGHLAALWRDDRDIDSPDVLKDLCRTVGLPEDLVDRALDPAPQSELAANLERAMSAGAIGSPTYVVDGEVFFGQDRLSFVEEALLAKR